MSAELKKTFDDILKEWGHNIILQRVLNPFKDYEEPKYANDAFPNGKWEKHTVRRTLPGSRSLGHVAQEEMEGILHQYEMIYYFRHNVNPVSGDVIYENEGPYRVTYTVDLAIPMRGVGGQIVYWAVGVDRN